MTILAYKIPKSVLENETLAKLSPHTLRCFIYTDNKKMGYIVYSRL